MNDIDSLRSESARASSRDPEQIKRKGWREQRILVVSADDQRLDGPERRFVEALANRLYGDERLP
jgi:hypothetical protein